MTDKPIKNTQSSPDDSNSADPEEEIVIDETEAGFLEDRDTDEYPSVLRITSEPEESHRRDALDRLDRWEEGEDVPHVINFQNPSDLRALLTDRRVELLQSVMADKPDSIRRLAERLDRDVKSVHDDLGVLTEYDIVHYEQDGRAKRPFVPYDTIEVSLEISTPQPTDDAVSA
ncbi:transcriptional regulator [Halovenus halobia]|uniref:HVO_A0114 family putative DNA-binding protein n=1 Tax=Halovenus halobia TaxID=3396622 RepID=UPI003F54DB9C